MSREAARVPDPGNLPVLCLWLCFPPKASGLPCTLEAEGQTLSSLMFSGAAPPPDRGYNGAPAPHYLAGGARESGKACCAGRSALCLGMAGPPGGPGAALRAAVSECLAPGSWGSKGSTFSLF